MNKKFKMFLLLKPNGDFYTGIHTLDEARSKCVELGGGIDIFVYVEKTPLSEKEVKNENDEEV